METAQSVLKPAMPKWSGKVEDILHFTHFAYPLILLILFLALFIRHSIKTSARTQTVSAPSNLKGPGGKPLPPSSRPSSNGPSKPTDQGFGRIRSLLFCWLSAGIIITFLCNAANIIVHALVEREKGWWAGSAPVTYVIASSFLYSLFLISLIDQHPSPNSVHFTTWVVALLGELILLAGSIAFYTHPHNELNYFTGAKYLIKTATQWEIIEIFCDAARVLLLTLMVAFYIFFTWQQRDGARRRTRSEREAARAERQPLLNHLVTGDVHVENGNATNGTGTPVDPTYGATENGHANGKASIPAADSGENAAFYRPSKTPSIGWWEYIRGFATFLPYLWPSKSLRLKILVGICFILVLLQRVVNFLVPLQMGRVVDHLAQAVPPQHRAPPEPKSWLASIADHNYGGGMPWMEISLLLVLKVFQGSGGFLGAARSVLWIPVSQYSYQALATASFEHVHSLSLDFHISKRTGEVLSALGKGASINQFLEQVTFQVIPMLFDLGVAIFYFAYGFDIYYALAISIVTFWYIYVTIRIAQWRAEQRRVMVNTSREEDAVKNDSLMSYETVKYFGAEEYEFNRYRKAVQTYQEAEYAVVLSINVLNVVQNLIFMLGYLVIAFIGAFQVTQGLRPVGDFVILVTYMAQLQGPLNFFGTFYRLIQSSMISGERLLELFKFQPSVTDEPGAKDLDKCEGAVTFEHCTFSYDARRPALNDLSFECKPGTTTALVGESGGGKSTVFRVLFRHYNAQEGRVLVDGHDVRDLTIKSLRSHIGVVPQDTVLFNETIMYNLRYANLDATDEDIYEACKAASIHDKILAFPDGYQSKVGERGLRLSGGEKQRVAIARTILKNPKIILLDEATAALDSETEQHIQEALKNVSKNRTMLVIAHRLSTITNSDQIVVIHQGHVYEKGTHNELLEKKGRYYNMWRKQIRAEKAAEEARLLQEQAGRLQEQAEAAAQGDHAPGTDGEISS